MFFIYIYKPRFIQVESFLLPASWSYIFQPNKSQINFNSHPLSTDNLITFGSNPKNVSPSQLKMKNRGQSQNQMPGTAHKNHVKSPAWVFMQQRPRASKSPRVKNWNGLRRGITGGSLLEMILIYDLCCRIWWNISDFFNCHSKGSKLLTRNKLEGLPNEGDARGTFRFASIIAREYPQFSSAAY